MKKGGQIEDFKEEDEIVMEPHRGDSSIGKIEGASTQKV
jgi:hypothetical protein